MEFELADELPDRFHVMKQRLRTVECRWGARAASTALSGRNALRQRFAQIGLPAGIQGKRLQQAAESSESLQVSSLHTGHSAGTSLPRWVSQSLGVSVLSHFTSLSIEG